jgi:hypothetical protein
MHVGIVGCWPCIANIANKLQFIQWWVCIQYCINAQCIQLGVDGLVLAANMANKMLVSTH